MLNVRQISRAFLLVIPFMLATGCKTRYEEIPPVFPDELTVLGQVDPAWKIRPLNGDTVSLGRFSGKKLFINIWGTWCQSCLLELPHLQTLYDSLRSDTTIEFLFISDEPDSTVRSFAAGGGYSLPFYICDSLKPKIFDTGSYPSTFISNARGEIVYRKLVSAKWSDRSVIEFLRDL